MSAELRRLFPEGLRNNEAERGKPRHEPPLRFAPCKSVQPDDGEDTNSKTITVELGQKTTMKVLPYIFIIRRMKSSSYLRLRIIYQRHYHFLRLLTATLDGLSYHSLAHL